MLSPNKIYPEIAASLEELYGINGWHYDVLWNNENLVIGVGDSVIRITPPNHRSKNELDAEVELLSVLRRNWCAVTNIISSRWWNLYENVETLDWPLRITVFRRLLWVGPKIDNLVERKIMVRNWWRTMGEIHRVSSQEQLLHKHKRLVWDEEVIIAKAGMLLPEWDLDILRELERITVFLKWIPITSWEYWLVHTDMRPRNFAYFNEQVTHFDFDDICHHWFIYDVAATALHETEELKTTLERTEFLKDFLSDFMPPYLEEKKTSMEMIHFFVLFMKLRCIYAYVDYYKRLKIRGIDSWKEKMMTRRNYILDFNTFIDTEEIELFLKNFYAE